MFVNFVIIDTKDKVPIFFHSFNIWEKLGDFKLMDLILFTFYQLLNSDIRILNDLSIVSRYRIEGKNS